MRNTLISLLLLVIAAGCATVPETRESKNVLSSQAAEAIAVFKARDPSIERFFAQSYGYAVFPKVGKGAFIVGGAHGKGEVYEQGQFVGYTTLTQATLGFSFGGELWREIIFFRAKSDLDCFRAGPEYTFAAQATGIALEEGVAAKADYRDGMAVFITSDKGLMVDASVGGQKFTYVPVR